MDGPLKWHGGKSYLASKIVAMMPPHVHYVEAYAGGLAVLLAKNPEGVSEVINDLNGTLTNFWKVMRSETQFPKLLRVSQATPFSDEEWVNAGRPHLKLRDDPEGDWGQAWKFLIRCRMSLAGRMDTFAPLSRTRTRRGMNEQASAWLSAVEGLPAVHERLKRVVVLNHDALNVIKQQDGPHTLFYLDPPYYPDTRASPKVYEHEMAVADHMTLLGLLPTLKGKFMLSGYHNASYDCAARSHGWKVHEFDLPNNSAGGSEKRRMTECLWTNF